ncbi:MAG: glycine--tRNA ligase subunit beta [Acidobacteriota bacterium]|nr:glycine--tRNA ligase subunit beta [Acidobacteriota bacterium]
MDRELLIEIGTEEIPASWLPGLTAQIGTAVEARLKDARLSVDEPVETYSTPRRLAARVGKIGERQSDLEELVTGPPVSAAFAADGTLTPAGAGFAKKQGVAESALERITTAKGEYIGVRKHQRGKTAVDVLPDVLAGVLRTLAFPKQMRWDAALNDGKGDLPFGRPIRWILYLYGGRVVPFTISRAPLAQGPRVQDVTAGAATYGHRFLTTSGRPGRAIKVKHFDDYRKRLAENFVVLERSERHDRIARELDAEARRRGGRIARALVGHGMLEEVPDLVEYPVVISGGFADEFLHLPEEVLTTTMIHHQHFFPIANDHGKLLPVFLAVLNMEPEHPEVIARNMERVLTARLRDARFFLDADRKMPLAAHVDRLSTVLFHKKLGSYQDKSVRVEKLARWICAEVFGRADLADHAAEAGRLCKADLATDMVRELTELQGTMGGIYARDNGRPEEVWKAIYYHHLPVGVEVHASPTKEQLGKAAITWAAVSLADKLDTLVGMFWAGERPTGSRDPLGLRRAMNGVMRILLDLHDLTGLAVKPTLGPLLKAASEGFEPLQKWEAAYAALLFFFVERYRGAFENRGYDKRNVRAITDQGIITQQNPEFARRILDELPSFVRTAQFDQLAQAFKRVKNILKKVDYLEFRNDIIEKRPFENQLVHPSEIALAKMLTEKRQAIAAPVEFGKGHQRAFAEAATLAAPIDEFFRDVMVMDPNPKLKRARLRLMWEVSAGIRRLFDPTEIISAEEEQDQGNG